MTGLEVPLISGLLTKGVPALADAAEWGYEHLSPSKLEERNLDLFRELQPVANTAADAGVDMTLIEEAISAAGTKIEALVASQDKEDELKSQSKTTSLHFRSLQSWGHSVSTNLTLENSRSVLERATRRRHLKVEYEEMVREGWRVKRKPGEEPKSSSALVPVPMTANAAEDHLGPGPSTGLSHAVSPLSPASLSGAQESVSSSSGSSSAASPLSSAAISASSSKTSLSEHGTTDATSRNIDHFQINTNTTTEPPRAEKKAAEPGTRRFVSKSAFLASMKVVRKPKPADVERKEPRARPSSLLGRLGSAFF